MTVSHIITDATEPKLVGPEYQLDEMGGKSLQAPEKECQETENLFGACHPLTQNAKLFFRLD